MFNKTKPLDLTKPVQYRNGEPCRIICTDGRVSYHELRYPIVSEDKHGCTRTHTLSGVFLLESPDDAYNLVNIPETKRRLKGWVNVYINHSGALEVGCVYATKEESHKRITSSYKHIACIDLSQFEEGHGCEY